MSSACYVYAIVRRDTPLPVAGADGARVELGMVRWRELAAVTGWIESAPLTMEALLRHEAVVEAVRRRGPALPVRFGTVFRDTASVASALAERYEPLTADLDRLGDKVEMSVTALWSTPPSGDQPSSPGKDTTANGRGAGARYMLARAAELRRDELLKQRAQAVALELDQVLGGLALERRVSLLPTPRVAVRAAYLLDPAQLSAFRAAFEATRGTRSELRVLLTGPWPPYSFVKRKEAEREIASDGALAALVQLLTNATNGRPG